MVVCIACAQAVGSMHAREWQWCVPCRAGFDMLAVVQYSVRMLGGHAYKGIKDACSRALIFLGGVLAVLVLVM